MSRTYFQWLLLGHKEGKEPDECQVCGLAYSAFEDATEPLGCQEVRDRAKQVQDRLQRELDDPYKNNYGY